MRTHLALALSLLVVGCPDSPSRSTKEKLEGIWLADSGASLILRDGTKESNWHPSFKMSDPGRSAWEGRWEVERSELVLHGDNLIIRRFEFVLNGDTLTLVGDEVVRYERVR